MKFYILKILSLSLHFVPCLHVNLFVQIHHSKYFTIKSQSIGMEIGVDSSYEILCKAFSDEAKAKLEVCFIPFVVSCT
ncbi:hypothetical protein CK203_112794 [Vitis vinifera]|uniref:Uncharacterized protein n=1 Tax=Vitis vinifera TaxID=29760 RepID=A0A438CGX4_VITVI|nr:hypothetical protein CK203_112794 [Vitis vinifera]